MTVVTGSIETKIHTNGPEPDLPPSSRYLPAQKRIVERSQGNDGIGRMTTEEFAARVVKDVLGGATGKIWRGKNATTVRYASIVLPTSIAVSKPDLGGDADFLTNGL